MFKNEEAGSSLIESALVVAIITLTAIVALRATSNKSCERLLQLSQILEGSSTARNANPCLTTATIENP
jgi:Flp pilus assembly pilin Flp